GDIDNLFRRPFTHLTEVFTNPVKYHNGVVQGVPNHGQHPGEHGQIKVPLEYCKRTNGYDDVMSQCQHRACSKLELEAKPDINQNRAQSQQHCQATLFPQLGPNLPADILTAAQSNLGAVGLQGFYNLYSDLFALLLKTNHHAGLLSKSLCHHVPKPGISQLWAHLANDRRLGILDFHQSTSGKVQTEVQPLDQQSSNGTDNQNGCQNNHRHPQLHEMNCVGGHD